MGLREAEDTAGATAAEAAAGPAAAVPEEWEGWDRPPVRAVDTVRAPAPRPVTKRSPDFEALSALETLKISHSEPMLSITDAAGRERVVYTDGRVIEMERSHGGKTKVEARWKDGRHRDRLEAGDRPEGDRGASRSPPTDRTSP